MTRRTSCKIAAGIFRASSVATAVYAGAQFGWYVSGLCFGAMFLAAATVACEAVADRA